MILVDTDVMVDIMRRHPPSVAWLDSLGTEVVGIPGLVAMELLQGCRNREEQQQLEGCLINWIAPALLRIFGMVPYSVIGARDICGGGKPTAVKKSEAPKSPRSILARCMALVPRFGPRILTSKFSYKDTPANNDWQCRGTGKNLAMRLKGLKMLFLLSRSFVVVGVPFSTAS
jgi:hypothetical protein